MILTENYFQFENNFYIPSQCIIMGSHIEGLVAEIFLQLYVHLTVKYMLEINNTVFYNRYDDILIIFDNSRGNSKLRVTFISTLSSN
jgi:hypothetical protein